jgi:hypothetical protein
LLHYVYCWTLRPDADLEIELRVRADSAGRARRALVRFVDAQAVGDWTICALSRSADGSFSEPMRLLPAGRTQAKPASSARREAPWATRGRQQRSDSGVPPLAFAPLRAAILSLYGEGGSGRG